jgi:hypothetical protein
MDERHPETIKGRLGELPEVHLGEEDDRWLELEAQRRGISKKLLIEQAITDLIASRPVGMALPDNPQELVSQAIRDLASGQKEESPWTNRCQIDAH